jgi:transitional endoplasmic reticulum ATPase
MMPVLSRNAQVAHTQTWLFVVAQALLLFTGLYRDAASKEALLLMCVYAGCFAALLFPAVKSTTVSYLCRIFWVFLAASALWVAWKLYPAYRVDIEKNTLFELEPAGLQLALNAYLFLCMTFVLFLVLALLSLFLQYRRDAVDPVALEDEEDNFGRFFFIRRVVRMAPALPSGSDFGFKELSTRDTGAVRPTLNFKSLTGNDALKAKLLDAAQQWKNSGKNGIFLYGEPGTGKTVFAEALAGELGLRIIKSGIGSVASRWVNQSSEQMSQLIDRALAQAPCVLFLDEIEALLPDRSQMAQSDSEEGKVVGVFLPAVAKLRAGRVLLIGATNYKDRVDAACIREGRFDFHIEVGVPDAPARRGLILKTLQECKKTTDPAILDKLILRWAGFNIPRLTEATRRAANLASTTELSYSDFKRGLRDVQGGLQGLGENVPDLKDLYFDEAVKRRLDRLAVQFRQVDDIEAAGGSVPKGIIFYGPPGTGKTTMAQSLAKAAGYTFISTNGKTLATEHKALANLRRKASDLRPAIVFIDEADDILGDRQVSGLKMQTNELLQTIDGAGQPLPDVVWILATNHIDGFDEAVYRRFPTKIELALPGDEVVHAMVSDWARQNSSRLSCDIEQWAEQVVPILYGLSPSAVTSILQTARNDAVADQVARQTAVSISPDYVIHARKEMRL